MISWMYCQLVRNWYGQTISAYTFKSHDWLLTYITAMKLQWADNCLVKIFRERTKLKGDEVNLLPIDFRQIYCCKFRLAVAVNSNIGVECKSFHCSQLVSAAYLLPTTHWQKAISDCGECCVLPPSIMYCLDPGTNIFLLCEISVIATCTNIESI